MKDLTLLELINKFSNKENWTKEHKYISTSRLLIGFILGTIFGLALSYFFSLLF